MNQRRRVTLDRLLVFVLVVSSGLTLVVAGWSYVDSRNERERGVASIEVGARRSEVVEFVGESDWINESGAWCYDHPWGGFPTGFVLNEDRVTLVDMSP